MNQKRQYLVTSVTIPKLNVKNVPPILSKQELPILASGSVASEMDRVCKYGQMEPDMKVNLYPT